jgi:hypothetical protein
MMKLPNSASAPQSLATGVSVVGLRPGAFSVAMESSLAGQRVVHVTMGLADAVSDWLHGDDIELLR